jgi:hypothetical protein
LPKRLHSLKSSRIKANDMALARVFSRPAELDIRGLGRKVCEVLGIRSGDTVEFHVLTDGSVRIINYGNKGMRPIERNRLISMSVQPLDLN